jgi:hypothetical protein
VKIKLNAHLHARVIRMLLDGPHTGQELAAETGLALTTVAEYLREMRRVKAAHISGWVKDVRGRDMIRIYTIGEGVNKKPGRTPGAERTAQYRERQRALQKNSVMAGAGRFVQTDNGRLRYEKVLSHGPSLPTP